MIATVKYLPSLLHIIHISSYCVISSSHVGHYPSYAIKILSSILFCRSEDDGKTGKHVGKIRGKEKELEEETVAAVNLPNISLPLTSLPKFDFIVPPASSTPAVTSTFKFASPITVTENARTCLPTDTFTFSKPISAVGNKDTTMSGKINCVGTSIPHFATKLGTVQFVSGSDKKSVSSEEGDTSKLVSNKNSQNSDVCFGIKPATELKSGSVMDILGKKPNSTDREELKEDSSRSFVSLDKFKPAPGTWECGLCMIRNKSDATKCIACETPRTSVGLANFTTSTPACPKTKSSALEDVWECSSCHEHNPCSAAACRKCLVVRTGQSPSEAKEPEKPVVSGSGFGSKFKPASDSWECSTCLVRNPGSSKQCQACETQRPALATKSSPMSSSKSSFGLGSDNRFKKPSGTWDCPDCMVQNSSNLLNCVACKRAKPGSECHSTVKFSFGIDKANVSVKESDSCSSNMQGFKFGETKATVASDFSFGVTQTCETKGSVLGTTSSPLPTTDVLLGDGFKKPSGTWNCPDCMVQNNNDSLKCVHCEKVRPDSGSQSALKFNFGIDKAGVSVKESDLASSSNMQGFKFGETKVTTTSDAIPRTPESNMSAVVTTGYSFGSLSSPLSVSNAVVKPADTNSLSQTKFSFGVPQPSEFQSPASNGDEPSGGVPKKCRVADADGVPVNSGDLHANSSLNREPATSAHTKQIDKNSDSKDHVTKRVTSSIGAAVTSEKPNISTNTTESAKAAFNFAVSSVGTTATDLNLSSVKPLAATIPSSSFTSSQATFGSNTTAAVTASSFGAATNNLMSTVISTTASNVFSFGSTKSCVTFGGSSQQSADASGSVSTFGTALKNTPSAFNFTPQAHNKEFVGATTSVTNTGSIPVFGATLKTTAAPSTFGFTAQAHTKESVGATASSFVPVTSAASITAFGPLTTTITSPSLPNFNSSTTTSNFGFGARATVPAFGTPSTSATSTTITTSSFSSTSVPHFSTGFSSVHEQKPSLPAINNSATSPAPFTFGSSLGQASFPFGNTQNDQGFNNKGAFSFGTASAPVANSSFQFASSSQAPPQVGPTFNFGSGVVTTSSAPVPSMFGGTPLASGPMFGAASPVFGANNPGSTNPAITTAAAVTPASSTPFNFGSSISQPSSNVFGFAGNQATGLTNLPVQNLTSPTQNFGFNQAQPSAQPAATAFDPSVRPVFNFTKGETPSFT